MEAHITAFGEVLRQNGVRVATAEVLDAARAVSLVGVGHREAFKAALRATLVKRERDVGAFERAFDFYFGGTAKLLEGLDRVLAEELESAGLLEGDELEMVLYTLRQLGGQLSPMGRALVKGDAAAIMAQLRDAALQLDLGGLQSPLQKGFFARRLMARAGQGDAERDVEAVREALEGVGARPEATQLVSSRLQAALKRVERAARAELDRQVDARVPPAELLANERLASLSPEELARAEAAVRALAEKLKSRWSHRRRLRRRGALDVRRTLRRNLTTGGVPMVPVLRGKRPERPELMVLCDISESVRNTARLMLLFTHALQSLFGRVRSFVFVSELAEVTALFAEREVNDAVQRAVTGGAVPVSSNSSYGRALGRFDRDFTPSVTRRTTVMVIGDGRNNYGPSAAPFLDALSRRARRLIWLCPEPRSAWGTGDSEMPAYARLCSEVELIRSLADLEQLASRLMPSR